MSEKNNKIYTVGHSTRSIDEFIEILQSFSIQALVDVRSMPGSRKFPHFDQDKLKKSLIDNQIQYHYFESLGGRRKVRKESINTRWRNKSFQAYADYMATDEFKKGIDDLQKLANAHKTVIMCAEAVWWRCHRSMIADDLKAKGWKVYHVMSQNKSNEHPYTSPARVVGDKVLYHDEELK